MYSEKVTATQIERLEQRYSTTLHRYTPAQSLELTAYITKRHADGQLLDDKGRCIRPQDATFIRNERALCMADFRYWLRYCNIIRSGEVGGGLGSLTPFESQEILLALIGSIEESSAEQHERYCYKEVESCMCDGICIVDNKGGRQLGHTAICRALTWHRVMMMPHTRGAAVSVDDDKLYKMYETDELIYNTLPFFLKPDLIYNEKMAHYSFDIGSSLIYQTSERKSGSGATVGIGTGGQFDISHMTEVSSYRYAKMLELDFFPTIPRNPYSLCILETTPLGRQNWWHDFSERVRRGRVARWRYLYIPFYAEPKKYRRLPPDTWSPNESTLEIAAKVYSTSREFVGKDVTLTREQMYWWECEYNSAMENNTLNLFLSNYSITPEQSFQSTTVSAINARTLDWMRTTTTEGIAYDFEGM